MLKRMIHWLVAIAFALHVLSCALSGVSYMPGAPF